MSLLNDSGIDVQNTVEDLGTSASTSDESPDQIIKPAVDDGSHADTEVQGSEHHPELDQTENCEVIEKQEAPKEPEAVDKDGEDDVGDISDGDSVDEEVESLRKKYVNMKERIQLAPKRVKQYNQYTKIMEERLSLLEDRCAAYDRKILKKNNFPPLPPPPPPPRSSSLDPALGFKFWQEFTDTAYESNNIIDVLVGEPEGPKRDRFRHKKPTANATDPDAEETIVLVEEAAVEQPEPKDPSDILQEVAALKGKQLPERIRFNIPSIRRLFWKFFNPAGTGPETDNILLRPFKTFMIHAEEIQELMSEVLEAVEETISQRKRLQLEEVQHGPQLDAGEARSRSPDQVSQKLDGAQDQEEPDAISFSEWESIVKKIDAWHCFSCSDTLGVDWPTKSALERSFQSIRDLLDNYLLPVHRRFRERRTDVAHFHDLWHVFQTGDVVITKFIPVEDKAASSIDQGMSVLLTSGGRRVIHTSYPAPLISSPRGVGLGKAEDALAAFNGVNCFSIHAYLLDFDGLSWIPVRRRLVILPYPGERKITDLDVYPVEYIDGAKERLHDRGKKFHELVTAKKGAYVDCSGLDLTRREEIDDKVVVDMKSYFDANLNQCPTFIPPGPPDMSETSDCDQGMRCGSLGTTTEGVCVHRKTKIIVDQTSDLKRFQAYIEGREEFNYLSSDRETWLPDFSICNHRVFVYKLQSREWMQVNVESIEMSKASEAGQGFSLLVLPEDHKHILESQVREHFRKRQLKGSKGSTGDDMDLVRGKGQGLIILLHGAPGVGKTCTAECIAEEMKKPLYPITCGDLGSTANDVEANLKRHFGLASKWDCVMLLDEADVFLARRRSEDLDRNSIVSVFLRMLEYYKGLLFLTTNRVGSFDEAFKSRVHISLFYPNFDKETTIQVWKTFIKQAKRKLESEGRKNVTVNSSEIKKFARAHWEENPKARWNGRQIRNAFHTAVAMAEFQARDKEAGEGYDANKDVKITIGREQFEKIAKTAKEFDNYMNETTGGTGDFKAAKARMRKREREVEKKKEREEVKAKEKRSKGSKRKEVSSDESDSSEDDVREKSGSKKAQGKKKSATESDDSDTDSE